MFRVAYFVALAQFANKKCLTAGVVLIEIHYSNILLKFVHTEQDEIKQPDVVSPRMNFV